MRSAPMLELGSNVLPAPLPPPWIDLNTPIIAYDVNTKGLLLIQEENMTTIISKLDKMSNVREILKIVLAHGMNKQGEKKLK